MFKKLKETTFSSLKIRNFRLYFIGQGISLCGTWMQAIGQAWLVLKLTNSGTALGLVTALQTLPVLILGPMGGVITDRFNKRKLLFLTQTISLVLAFALAVLVSMDLIRLWEVFVLAIMLGLTNALDNPTRQTFVHEMVGREELNNAVALNSIAVNVARVVGPAFAGAIIAGISLSACFYINAISFLAVLYCLFLMKAKELIVTEKIHHLKGELLKGFAYVKNTPIIRDVLIMMAVIGTFTFEFQVSLPLVSKYTFNTGAGSFAFLTSAMGIGAVIGGLINASKKQIKPAYLVWMAFLFAISMVLTAISPTLFIACLAMVLVGIASTFTALANATLQHESSPEMRGRVIALWSVTFMGSTPIGGPLIGWIGEHIDPRWSMGVGGIAAVVAAVYGLMTLSKKTSIDPKSMI